MLNDKDAYAVAFWGDAMADEEPLREEKFPLVEVQTAIARRVIEKHLTPQMRILDAGAGAGRYSLPLAALGHKVTHLDVSEAMLARAMSEAARQGLSTIEFRTGDVKRLEGQADRAYDMTLCLDAPISYAYPHQEQAIAEVCRVTNDLLVLMVSSRSGVLPFMLDLDVAGEFTPPEQKEEAKPFLMTRGILERGVENFPPEVEAWLEREGKRTPPDYAFTVEELTNLVRSQGFRVIELGGPGALARSVKPETLTKVRNDAVLWGRFLDLSMTFDFDPHNLGLGAVNLLLVAQRVSPKHSKSNSKRRRR